MSYETFTSLADIAQRKLHKLRQKGRRGEEVDKQPIRHRGCKGENVSEESLREMKSQWSSELGLSTLMELQTSRIKPRQHSQQLSNRLSQGVSEVQKQMRKKLMRIELRPLNIPAAVPYQPISTVQQQEFEDRDRLFRNQLSQQIQKLRISKFIKAIRVYAFKQFHRELSLYDHVVLSRMVRNHKISREYFTHWRHYTRNEAEKQRVTHLIREKIISRRREQANESLRLKP